MTDCCPDPIDGVDVESLSVDDAWTMSGPDVDEAVAAESDDAWTMSGAGVDQTIAAGIDDSWTMSGAGVDDAVEPMPVESPAEHPWSISLPDPDPAPVATPTVDAAAWTMSDPSGELAPSVATDAWTMNAGPGTTAEDLVVELHGPPGGYVDPTSLQPGFHFDANGTVEMSDGLGPREGTIDPATALELAANAYRAKVWVAGGGDE